MKKCCFIGHNDCEITDELRERVQFKLRCLILNGAKVFYFGIRNTFTDLCYEAITELQMDYPKIKRVYVGVKESNMDKENADNLLHYYDGILYLKEGNVDPSLAQVKQTKQLIERSHYCFFYFDRYCTDSERGLDEETKKKRFFSMVRVAFNYATFKHKVPINAFNILAD